MWYRSTVHLEAMELLRLRGGYDADYSVQVGLACASRDDASTFGSPTVHDITWIQVRPFVLASLVSNQLLEESAIKAPALHVAIGDWTTAAGQQGSHITAIIK